MPASTKNRPLLVQTIYSDASSHACWSLLAGTDHVAHRMFTETEQAQSSTFRELWAVQFGIVSFKSIIQGCNVKGFTGNKSAMKIAQVGSMSPTFHQLAIEIFSICFTAGIQLDIQWRPRAQTLELTTLVSLLIMTIGKSLWIHSQF